MTSLTTDFSGLRDRDPPLGNLRVVSGNPGGEHLVGALAVNHLAVQGRPRAGVDCGPDRRIGRRIHEPLRTAEPRPRDGSGCTLVAGSGSAQVEDVFDGLVDECDDVGVGHPVEQSSSVAAGVDPSR